MSECIDHGCKGYGKGYATAWLTVHGKRISTTKHRQVFYNKHGYLPEVVMHTCDNPRCINVDHLVAGTQLDNVRDMHNKSRQGDCRNFGTANGMCVLSDEDVQIIRATYIKGSRDYGLPALAKRFGVGTSQIHRIVKHVHRV